MAAAVRRGAAVIAGAGMLVALAFLPQVRGGRPRAACGGRDGGPPLPSRPPDPEHTMDPAASPGRARAAGAGALHVAETFLFHMRRNYIDVRAELYSDIAARLEAAGLPPAQDRSPQASDGARRRPGELFDEPQELQSSPWNSDRQIARVPGLKRFLMAHWRTHAAGRDHETPMTEIRRPEWFGPWPEEDYPPEIKDGVWAAFVHASQWRLIPNVLATHWPDDPEVLTLIWEARDYLYTLADTDPDAYAANLFDRGKFDTPEANSLRETVAGRSSPALQVDDVIDDH